MFSNSIAVHYLLRLRAAGFIKQKHVFAVSDVCILPWSQRNAAGHKDAVNIKGLWESKFDSS